MGQSRLGWKGAAVVALATVCLHGCDNQCADDEVQVDGACVRSCNVNENCDVGEACVDGACRPATTGGGSSGTASGVGSGNSSGSPGSSRPGSSAAGNSSRSSGSNSGGSSTTVGGVTSGAGSSAATGPSSAAATSAGNTSSGNVVASSGAGSSAAGSSAAGSSAAGSSAGGSSAGASSAGGTSAMASSQGTSVPPSSLAQSSSAVFSSSNPVGGSSVGGTTSSSTSTTGGATGSTGGPSPPTLIAIQPLEVLQHDAPQRLNLLATNVSLPCEVLVGQAVGPCEVEGMALFVTLTPEMVAFAGQESVAIRELNGPWSNDLALMVRPSGAATQWWVAGLDSSWGGVHVQLFNPFPRAAQVQLLHVLGTGGQVMRTVQLPPSTVQDVDVLGANPGRGSGGDGAVVVTSDVPVVVSGTINSTTLNAGSTLTSLRAPVGNVTIGSRNTNTTLVRTFHLFNPGVTAAGVTLRAQSDNGTNDTPVSIPSLGVVRYDAPTDAVLANGVWTRLLTDAALVVTQVTREADDMLSFDPQVGPAVDHWMLPANGSETGIRVALVNDGPTAADATVRGYSANANNSFNVNVPPFSQRVVAAAPLLGLTGDVVLHVTSSAPLYAWAERSRASADNCVLQSTHPARDALLPSLRNVGGTPRAVVFNPTLANATVSGMVMREGGAMIAISPFSVPAETMVSIPLVAPLVTVQADLAVRLESDVEVVFGGERPHPNGMLRCPPPVLP